MTASPPDTRPVRRLHRRTDRQVIGGVAAGMADYFNVDPVLVRIAFVVLIFVGGIGPLLYVLAWLFVPAADSGESIAQAALRRPASLRTYVGVALVLVAVAILASSVSRPSVIWAVALIAFGVFLFRQEPDAPARAPESAGPPPPVPPAEPPFPPAEPAAAAPATTGTVADAVTEPLEAPPSPGAPPPRWEPPEPRVAWGAPRPPRPPRSWSPLGPLTLGAAFLATGAAVALDNLGAVELTLGRALAVFLTVLGLGLLVGTWWGRAWSLIPVGLLLVPVVAAASLLGSEPVAAGAGNRLWQPRTVAEVQPSYRLGAGQAVVDLSGVRLGAAPTRVDVGLGAGRIVVVVPDDAPVQLRGRVGIGSVTLLGRTEQGAKVDTSRTDGPLRPRKGDPPGRLTLDLHLGYGVIEVHRASELPLADVPGLTGPPPTTLREVP
ncbi:MAG TPA: PspC domain-containing protein [Actinomycetes bacterium]|nr:PspC domain-containing protein [Actinomycetes bacterium]